MIYLDNAATTKVAPEVIEAMMPYLTDEYGNAGTLYQLGKSAAAAVQHAREQTAGLFNCTPEHVIFTSGGSESNNTVFQGLRHKLSELGKKHIVVSAIEHDSVLRAAEMLTKDEFYITYVRPNEKGVVTADAVEAAIREDTGLVSVMYVNNETGAVNNIHAIGQICKIHSAFFHTDCVQAAGQFPIDVDADYIDFASISSHKLYGPKGVGALYVRDKNFSPLISGGAEQEFGVRGGTENVYGIVGFGKACELAKENLRENNIQLSILKQKFYTKLMNELQELGIGRESVHVNGRPVIESGKTLNLCFSGVDAETMLLMLNTKGVYVSAGSACSSHEAKPSHVLLAMGLTPEEARSSLRFSFSKYNTDNEMECAAQIIASCIFALQRIAREVPDENMEDSSDLGDVR